jgi:hypothetical protein
VTSTPQTDVNRPPHRWRSLGSAYVPPVQGPSLRSFGLTVGGVLAGVAGLSAWRGHIVRAEVVGAIAAVLIVLALVRPVSLARPAAVWSRIGHALGWFNSRVLLTVIFVLVMWPISLASRLFGSDPLDRRRRSGSMWTAYPDRLRDPKHFEHLF